MENVSPWGIGPLCKLPCLVCLGVCCDRTGPLSVELEVVDLSEEVAGCADDELGLWR